MIWTRSLLIWSQTRYLCATRSKKERWCFLCRGLDAFTTKHSLISIKKPKRSGFLNFFVCCCGFQSFWGTIVCIGGGRRRRRRKEETCFRGNISMKRIIMIPLAFHVGDGRTDQCCQIGLTISSPKAHQNPPTSTKASQNFNCLNNVIWFYYHVNQD